MEGSYVLLPPCALLPGSFSELESLPFATGPAGWLEWAGRGARAAHRGAMATSRCAKGNGYMGEIVQGHQTVV